MSLTAEEVVAAQEANLQAAYGLTAKAFEGFEKLLALNLTATKAAMAEFAALSQAALHTKDPQEFLALQASLLQPTAEKSAAYGRHVYDIATATSAEFTKAVETKGAELQKAFMTAVDTASKNAPAGSETFVAIAKSATAAANNAIESAQKAAKQFSDMAEANMNAVAATAVSAAKAPAAKKR